MSEFWNVIDQQLTELRTAKTADDVLTILAPERDPYGPGHSTRPFFAGSGGDETVMDSLDDAGWRIVWAEASYYYIAEAPNGDRIAYIEGDVERHTGALPAEVA